MALDQAGEKQAAALRAVSMITDGMLVGDSGSGSTAALAVRAIGERVRGGLRIEAVPTSTQTRELALQEGIPLVALGDAPLDLAIDGADEVDPQLRMIKGGGGALLREKIVAHAAMRFVIIVDTSKLVRKLGAFPLPLEVLPFALGYVLRWLREAGMPAKVRLAPDGSHWSTDQGNVVVDCALGTIERPEDLARELSAVPGIVGHGLFLTEADIVLVGDGRELVGPSSAG